MDNIKDQELNSSEENQEKENASEAQPEEVSESPEPSNKAQEQINQLKDQLLRAVAESENLRKRMEKQIEDTAKYAVSSFAKDLINVSENLFRALSNFDIDKIEDKVIKSILEGVVMTQKELHNAFEKHKIIIVQPKLGDAFDHNLHQAVSQIENNELPAGTIGQVLQNGYMLHDRVLRPAMVMVVKES
ncbi:MAG: nucleotide exchange factor GrpE [Sphingobacteriia bacterium]|nr:nucleotide exchange factor GrpE [Sphingobacteriia bacterium]